MNKGRNGRWSPVGLVFLVIGLCGNRPLIPVPVSTCTLRTGSRQLGRLTVDSLPVGPLLRRTGSVRFGFGRPATADQISALDIDVRPDGTGLPAGSGTPAAGAVIFTAKCAVCHGAGGIGGPNGSLVTTLPVAGKRADKVIGNYWPYATTVFDYIRRAMPFNAPGSLTDEEVYALTAYLLTANKLLDAKAVLNARTLPAVKMPAQPLFVPDDRTGGPEIH